jgi:hypothetical protein
MVATKENGIQPVMIVDGGGVPVPPVPGDTPNAVTFQQLLSAGPLDATDTVVLVKNAEYIAFAFSNGAGGGLTNDQTLNVIWKSSDGAAFDVNLILDETIPAGTKNKWFSFPQPFLMRTGDHIEVTLTDTGSPGDTVSGTIMFGT